MDIRIAEGVARELYRLAGADGADPPGPAWLAARLFGPCAIEYVRGLAGDAMLVPDDDGWMIRVRSGLSPERETYAVAHELGEWGLRDVIGEDIEQLADLTAACIIAPRAAFRTAVRAIGRDLQSLARAFVATESMVALRIGEVTGQPVALVTPHRVRVRGDEWTWPSEGAIRGLARCGVPGAETVRLHDDARRVALFVSQ